MAALLGITGSFRGRSYPLEGVEVPVGRRENNTIVLADSSVSGSHAKLIRQETGWLLKDLASTNGTRVNGLAIEETRLQERDQVQFGSIAMVFTLGSPDAINLDEVASQPDAPDIELTAELAVKPETFSSHSPFAAQKRQRTGWWNVVVALIGGLALIGVLVLFFILFFT